MNTSSMNLHLVTLALVGSTSLLGSAQAFVPWANASGSGTNFDWINGGSDTNLFGSPILVGGDTFRFFPSNFTAQSSDGHVSQTHDRIQVELLAHEGLRLEGVTFINTWAYNVIGAGSSVQGFARISVTDLNNFRTTSVTYTLPAGLTGAGELQAGPRIDLTQGDMDWTHIYLVVDTNFIATSGPGGFASISRTGDCNLQVPTPGSLALLGVAGLVALRRRR